MKQEFLMLAKDFDSVRNSPTCCFASEKLDGMRVFWDGGITRNIACSEVPWANTAKDFRYKEVPYATGLWSRYAKPVFAPDWFLDSLPNRPLDGEMTMGRQSRQELMSCIKKLTPDDSTWGKVRYAIFESPPIQTVLADRYINTTNMKRRMVRCFEWAFERYISKTGGFETFLPGTYFPQINKWLQANLPSSDSGECYYYHPQEELSLYTNKAIPRLTELLNLVENLGGEGIMLRSPVSAYKTERSVGLMKFKKQKDSEAMVIGYKWADKTNLDKSITGDETNKLLGLMGSLRVRWNNVEFDLSGFTNDERRMCLVGSANSFQDALDYGTKHPGEKVDPVLFWNSKFPIGSLVTFKYVDITRDGLPVEARYWRKPELP